MAVRRSFLARIPALWALFARMDLIWMTRDLRFFLTCYVSDVLMNLAAVTGTLLLAERFQGIGVWTKPQVIFLLGYAIAATGIMETLLGFNLLYVSRRIGRGQLDHTLIQPQPLWVTFVTEGFVPFSGSAILLPGFGLMLWALRLLAHPITARWLALLIVHLAASGAVVAAFSFLWGSLAFWAPREAEEVSTPAMSLMNRLKSFPIDGLAPALMGGLLFVFPVGFVAWYPCRYLLGIDRTPWHVIATPLAATALCIIAAGAFSQGLKHYGRTGSQRYLLRGHRR